MGTLSWVGIDLPVQMKRVALGKRGDNDSDISRTEEGPATLDGDRHPP